MEEEGEKGECWVVGRDIEDGEIGAIFGGSYGVVSLSDGGGEGGGGGGASGGVGGDLPENGGVGGAAAAGEGGVS